MTDLTELRNDIMRHMYNEADPGLDWDEVIENPDIVDGDWYKDHTLAQKRQREIFNKHVSGESLSSTEHARLSLQCLTSFAPATPDSDQ
jgi:hypothetical protein